MSESLEEVKGPLEEENVIRHRAHDGQSHSQAHSQARSQAQNEARRRAHT